MLNVYEIFFFIISLFSLKISSFISHIYIYINIIIIKPTLLFQTLMMKLLKKSSNYQNLKCNCDNKKNLINIKNNTHK